MDAYRTVAGRGECAFAVRGSRFRGVAATARTVDEAEAFLTDVRENHPDATHVVPAYRVRTEDGEFLREWSSDDGEPTGSAGKPALNVLQGREVENCVVAIVRHYGGTNLGVGGLVSAYSRAAAGALDDAGVVEERPHEDLTLTAAYDDSGTVRGILESAGVDFEATYEEQVTFAVRVPRAESEALRERLRNATSGRVG